MRSIWATTGYAGDHGFNLALPSWVRDGQPHRLFAHGIDLTRSEENRLLAPTDGVAFTLHQ